MVAYALIISCGVGLANVQKYFIQQNTSLKYLREFVIL